MGEVTPVTRGGNAHYYRSLAVWNVELLQLEITAYFHICQKIVMSVYPPLAAILSEVRCYLHGNIFLNETFKVKLCNASQRL